LPLYLRGTGGALGLRGAFQDVASGHTVVFEFTDEDNIAGESVSNRIAMSMDVGDGRVEAIREYVGIIG